MSHETHNIFCTSRSPRINGNRIMRDLMGTVPEPDAIEDFLETHFPEKVNNVSLWLERDSRSAVVIERGRVGPSGEATCDEVYVIPLTDEQFEDLASVYRTRIEEYMDTAPTTSNRNGKSNNGNKT